MQPCRRAALEQGLVGDGVGQPRCRAHHRRIERSALERAVLAHHHVGGEAQPVDVRGERAQVIGQCRGQHRHHAGREIHRRAAQFRLRVDGGPRAHVVAHVGDGDDEAITLAMRLCIQRVVEVAGIHAVDRDQRQCPQVDARLGLARVDVFAEGVCLAQRLRRELVRQRELRQCGFGGQLHRPLRVQALLDDRLGGRGRACVPCDPGDHPVTGTRAVQVVRGDRAAQLQAPVGGTHPRTAALDFHRTEEGGHATLEDLLERAGPAVGRIAGDLHPQAIPVHDAAHLRRRQEDALLEAINLEEAIAGAVGADGPLDDGTVPDGSAGGGRLGGAPCGALLRAAVTASRIGHRASWPNPRRPGAWPWRRSCGCGGQTCPYERSIDSPRSPA